MSHSTPHSPALSVNTAQLALDRRSLLKGGVFGAGLAAAPLTAQNAVTGFTHGIASGEPSATNVWLWTRYSASQDTELEWQVAENPDFTRPVSEGKATAQASRDFCAKAIANGLEAGRWYYYRFIAPDGTTSDTGRTRTLPEGPVSRYRLAVFSCSNYGYGYFNAYAHAAEANDFDLLVHLGDYIYEYGTDNFPNETQATPGRLIAPTDEIVRLADYRMRHATYRADPDLRRMTQLYPMIMVWDDHESANDSWMDGAQNHQPETEGSWAARKRAAIRAYREWLPVSDDPWKAYEVGDLATLFRLDTRLAGRDEQFNLERGVKGQETPEGMTQALESFRDGEYLNPARQLLGQEQEDWLFAGLRRSKREGKRWQVLVQQVLMGKLSAPSALLAALPDTIPADLRQQIEALGLASAAGLPLNMDAWDGYPAARTRVFEAALAADANLVVLAGDTHNGWAFDLTHQGNAVGVEFGTSSVSSPGFEAYVPFVPPPLLSGALVQANPQLRWADTSQRGYLAVDLTPESVTGEWRFVRTTRERETALASTHSMTSAVGSNGLA